MQIKKNQPYFIPKVLPEDRKYLEDLVIDERIVLPRSMCDYRRGLD
jgi:hypothetical protein